MLNIVSFTLGQDFSETKFEFQIEDGEYEETSWLNLSPEEKERYTYKFSSKYEDTAGNAEKLCATISNAPVACWNFAWQNVTCN